MSTAKTRREILNTQMDSLAESQKDCSKCTGLCCTYLKNSMQTTHEETLDLYLYLKESGRLDQKLVETLKQCVSDYRLDKSFGDGRRSLRKTYTCPFYNVGPKGCSIPRSAKPYGCLAFNPTLANVSDGTGCESDQSILIKREEAFGASPKIHDKLWWDKLPMPLALLEVIKLYGVSGDQV